MDNADNEVLDGHAVRRGTWGRERERERERGRVTQEYTRVREGEVRGGGVCGWVARGG